MHVPIRVLFQIFFSVCEWGKCIAFKTKCTVKQKILLPTAELIEAFTEKVQPMIDIMDDLNRQNDLLTKQRDMLLPRLMSGKIEV